MRGIYRATEQYPLNPRNLSIQSAFEADMEFVHAFNCHLAWHQHAKDKQKKGR